MSSRFIIVPENTVTAVGLETVLLEPDVLPSSLYLDFDASESSSITKDGSDNVASWVSKLGTEELSQATTANKPLFVASAVNGKSSLKFGTARSSNNFIASSADILGNIANPYTWAMVVKVPTAAVNYALWCASATVSGNPSVFCQVAGQLKFRHSSEQLHNLAFTQNAWMLLIGQYDGTNSIARINNGSAVTAAIGAPTSARKLALGTNGVINSPGDLEISRVLWFSSLLNGTELGALKRIMNSEYALWTP